MAMAVAPTETESLDDVFVDQPQLIGEMTTSSHSAFDNAGDESTTLNTVNLCFEFYNKIRLIN